MEYLKFLSQKIILLLVRLTFNHWINYLSKNYLYLLPKQPPKKEPLLKICTNLMKKMLGKTINLSIYTHIRIQNVLVIGKSDLFIPYKKI